MTVHTPERPLHLRASGSSASLRALLDGLVDYAGLFPPASLAMAEAVRRYAEYRAGPHGWVLGRFVVPVARLGEFEAHAEPHFDSARDPWRLSVLANAADRAILDAFNARYAGRAMIDTVETRAAARDQIADAALLTSIGGSGPGSGLRAPGFTVYVELPLDPDPVELVAEVARRGLRAKVRTGGVTRDAVPGPHALARFLAACTSARVPFKATAGLHHAWRGEYALTYDTESPSATMFGFLNVAVAAVFAGGGMPEASLIALLEERRGRSVTFDDAGIVWRGLRVATRDVAESRTGLVVGIGSCSFDEAVRELAALGLL